MQRLKRIALRVLIGALAFIGVGYLSSATSQIQVENHVALGLIDGPMQSKPFYVVIGDEPSLSIFNRVGGDVTEYSACPLSGNRIKYVVWPGGKEMPSADQGGRVASVAYARITWPFLVNVRYSSSEASLSGGGGTRYYLCLFGLITEVKEDQDWVS